MAQSTSLANQNALPDALAQAALAPPASATDQQTFAAFVDNFFYLLFIQDDDEIFNIAFYKLVNQGDEEDFNNSDGKKLTFAGFKRVIEDLREAVSGRRHISSKVLLSPELLGQGKSATATAGHTAMFQGIDKQGDFITLSVIAVGTVLILENGLEQLAVEKIIVTRNPVI